MKLNKRSQFVYMKSGFSLIELLVVISIIAVLVGLGLPNFIGARERARDAKRKAELNQLKTALRMYYNDYRAYPVAVSPYYFQGCGAAGDATCPGTCTTGQFSAGGVDGCSTVYMRKLPTDYKYYRHPLKPADRDDFLLKVDLDNTSDSDIAASQSRCGYPTPTPKEYHVCAD